MRVFLVAGEESGDQLGASVMGALRRRLAGNVAFEGVGGKRMQSEGLQPLFPIADLSHNGIAAVIANLPLIRRRMRQVVSAVLESKPDVLLVIDSPDFNLRVASRVRARDPDVAIVSYVSPTVWAWRPGRARRMARFVDHLMAVLPFEPEVHRRLDGPPCTYVGHPLLDRLDALRPRSGERRKIEDVERPVLLVLPGSRASEVQRLLKPFGETLRLLRAAGVEVEAVVPAVAHLVETIRAGVAEWPVTPHVIEGEAAKLAAFRRAHAALVASGTATLELALSAVPMVVAYKLDAISRRLKFMIDVPSIVLANLVLGEKAVPEFVDDAATPAALADALGPLLRVSRERSAQLAAFARLDGVMRLEGSGSPAAKAAETLAGAVASRRDQRRLEIGT